MAKTSVKWMGRERKFNLNPLIDDFDSYKLQMDIY